MTCADCARHISAALQRAGARDVTVDWRAGQATLSPEGADEPALRAAFAGTR